MPLIYILFVLVLAGMGLWLINRYIPMAGGIRRIINVVVVVAVCVWLLQSVGLWNEVLRFRAPHF
jgi:hypothetical protein